MQKVVGSNPIIRSLSQTRRTRWTDSDGLAVAQICPRFRYGIGGPGQVPSGPTNVSPCLLCAGSALFETVITTQGFFAE